MRSDHEMPETRLRIVIVISVLLASMVVARAPTLGLQDSKIIPSYGTVVYSSTLQVPPDGYCYHSAFVRAASALSLAIATAINHFVDLTGKGIFLYNDQGCLMLGEPLWMCMPGSSGYDCAPLIQEGLIQAIMVGFWPTVRNSSTGQAEDSDTITVQQIANGTWDSYITSLADEAKEFGYPIFLRIGSEMNINQGTGTWAGEASFGENATAFVAAWQRIVTIFRSENTSNVVFVWNPNFEDIGPNHWTNYYPGNSYVDWVGIDLYQYQTNTDPNTLLGIYNDYNMTKPIAICEWGTNVDYYNYTDQSRADFINRFFDAVEARPDIKMITYQYSPPDFSFNSTSLPLTTSAYVNRISNPRYIAQPPNG